MHTDIKCLPLPCLPKLLYANTNAGRMKQADKVIQTWTELRLGTQTGKTYSYGALVFSAKGFWWAVASSGMGIVIRLWKTESSTHNHEHFMYSYCVFFSPKTLSDRRRVINLNIQINKCDAISWGKYHLLSNEFTMVQKAVIHKTLSRRSPSPPETLELWYSSKWRLHGEGLRTKEHLWQWGSRQYAGSQEMTGVFWKRWISEDDLVQVFCAYKKIKQDWCG